ncbi:MAG TPA: hypothetical protein VJP90_07435, partial [Paenarthrobacter sp.]|nr:hypothetical protein [Paenarthrobacter sp.]
RVLTFKTSSFKRVKLAGSSVGRNRLLKQASKAADGNQAGPPHGQYGMERTMSRAFPENRASQICRNIGEW